MVCANETVQFWDFESPPVESELTMELRLVYKGPLPAESKRDTRAAEKHAIRKQLHRQLVQYWNDHPHLRMLLSTPAQFPDLKNRVAQMARKFNRGGHDFVPLVRDQEEMYCSIDILFLRRDPPGEIVSGGGDLDNRLKTFFDALRVPSDTSGLPDPPEPDFNPIFCLLRDDIQITSVRVTTDRLLAPLEDGEKRNDVLLVTHVHLYRGTNVTQVTGLPGNID